MTSPRVHWGLVTTREIIPEEEQQHANEAPIKAANCADGRLSGDQTGQGDETSSPRCEAETAKDRATYCDKQVKAMQQRTRGSPKRDAAANFPPQAAVSIEADHRLRQVILEYLNPAPPTSAATLATGIPGGYPGSCHCCASVNLVNRLKRLKAGSHHQLFHHEQPQHANYIYTTEGGGGGQVDHLVNSSLEAERNLQAALKRLQRGTAESAAAEEQEEQQQSNSKTLAALPAMPSSGIRRQADDPEADRQWQQRRHAHAQSQEGKAASANPRLRLPELATDRWRQRLEFSNPEPRTRRYARYQARGRLFQDADSWN